MEFPESGGNELIFDAHCHIGREHSKSRSFALSADELVNIMDRNGIDKAIVCSMGKGLNVETSRANDEISSAVRKHPDRLVGFAGANPWHEDAALDELERGVKRLGLRGLKLHPDLQGFPASDDLVYPLIRRAGELKIPVYVHSGTSIYSQPMEIGEMALSCPETTVIMGHMGYDNYYFDAIPAARRSHNLILETSRNAQYWTIEESVEAIGPDRVVFGTDAPYSKAEVEIARIKSLKLDSDVQRKILGENISKILQER